MRKLIKPISIVLTIAYLLLIPFSAYAAIGTISTNSSNSLLDKWQGYGLVDNSITDSELYEPVQKIEFITLINGILKSSKQADISFSDIPKGSWYGTEIAKAVAAGYVDNKDKTKYNPFSNISRLDAAIIVAHVFGLELKDKKLLNTITDAESLDAKQLADFGAVIENGGLFEISKGRYAPSGVLRIIDALKMLDNCVGQLVTKAGTITSNVSGNMLINVGSVTLKKITVNGDLIIGEGVGEGDVKLENTTIKGKLIIRGGGANSVTLNNTQVGENLVVEKSAGNVHVKLLGTTTIDHTYLKSGCSLEEQSLSSGKGFINVTAEKSAVENQTAELKGNFNNIQVANSNINVKLNGSAENINISKEANTSFTLIGGSAKTISTQASKNTMEFLGGIVTTLNVDAGAKGNRITVNGATTISAINVKSNTTFSILKGTVEKLTLESTAESSYISMMTGGYLKNFVANSGATVTGYGKIDNAYVYANNVSMDIRPGGAYVASGIVANINGTNIDPTKTTVSISVPNEINLQENETKTLNVNRGDPYNSTLSYISSDNNIATVNDKGEVKGISAGSTKVHVTAQYPGYNTSVAAIKVNVTSGNVTGVGTLTIDPPSGETGTSRDFTITYTAGNDMSNGTAVIKLPTVGFSVFTTDTVRINGAAEKALDKSQVLNIQTLSFTNLNLKKGETIVVSLKNRIVPPGGEYQFTAISDADGTGPKLPTSGEEKGVFTSNNLKELMVGYNYSTPTYGTTGGSIKIDTLSFVGITSGAEKWLMKVQNVAFTALSFNEDLTSQGYNEYTKGSNINVVAGQHMLLAAVDASNKVKAYKDITINSSWIRPDDAGKLELGVDYKVPETGIEANTVRLNDLNLSNISGAAKWMYKVQSAPATDVYVNHSFVGATQYTSGDDIKVYENQHVILAATTSDSSIKAYADITVKSEMISKPAGDLILGNNFSLPEYGTSPGAIQIKTLTSGAPNGFNEITKWRVVTLSKAAVKPAKDVTTDLYEKYTEGKHFSDFTAGSNIAVVENQHLLLVGTDASNKIQAHVDLVIDALQIRQADVLEIPDENFSAPVMGTAAGTTKFTRLDFSTAITGATKYMYKVQNGEFTAPQINSTLSGAKDLVANQNVDITDGQHLILLATDNNGKIKAFKDIVVSGDNQIRPADAFALKEFNNYSLLPGTVDGSTKAVLSSAGIPGWVDGQSTWRYIVQSAAFETPYKSSIISGSAIYVSGENILNVSVGQNILIIAVDASGKTLAYVKTGLTQQQIKQPSAGTLKSSDILQPNEFYNYSVPEPGTDGGTTKIATLNTMGIQEATKWLYQVLDASATVTAPEYNKILTGLPAYLKDTSVKVTAGQHFVLYATDSQNKVKAYKDIVISQEQIRTPAAATLVSPTNYAAPSQGTTQGAIVIASLSFAGLEGQNTSWSWKYAVGNTLFSAPMQNSSISAIGFTTNDLITTTNVSVKAGQYILLLAVDNNGAIKGYANVYVQQSAIRPFDADAILTTSYSIKKGTEEGTTSFSKLDLIGIPESTTWMIKIQKAAFEIPAKDVAVTLATLYNHNLNPMSNIKIEADSHILLLATDQLGRVKAYADITVTEAAIQAPYANLLVPSTNYTDPQQGTTPGSIKIMLNDAYIPKASGETIVWKYKIGTIDFKAPLLDEVASGSEWTSYTSNGDIPVIAGNVVLVTAVISSSLPENNNKIKAFRQFTISPSQIKPPNAPELVLDYNYSGPVLGNTPGTTKLTDLNKIGVVGADNTKWQVKVINSAETLTLDSIFTNPIDYSSGVDITVKMNQFVVLALVDASGKVKAYKNIQITLDSQLNPPLADKLKAGTNYATPKYGSVTGTTSIYVSTMEINGAVGFVAKVVPTAVNITAGSIITTGSGIDFVNYQEYATNANIPVSIGQYVLLCAVDTNNKVMAFENIKIEETNIRPGDAITLKTPDNYSVLVPGAGIGTTKFTYLAFVGVPGGDTNKWVIKVQDISPAAILMNSSVEGAIVYDVNKDITAKEGQYVVLYAVDVTGRIKAYTSVKVGSENVRGIAPILKLNDDYTEPVPGSVLNTTKIMSLPTVPTVYDKLWYTVQDSPIGDVLKDGQLTGLTQYTVGTDIPATEGRHLVLVATDDKGYTKAYKDILLNSSHIRNIEATLSGTIITAPTGESNIASGGRTIIVQLAFGEWQDDVLTNTTKRNAFFDGFIASGSETAQWGKVIAVLKNEAAAGAAVAVMNTDKKTITITLSETIGYDITKTQEIALTIKPELIKNAIKAAASVNTIVIAANVVVQLDIMETDGTTISPALAEGDIKAGGKKIVIKLTNGEYAADVASSTYKRNAIFEGFKATNNAVEWDKVITTLKAAGEAAITRNSSSKITISLPGVYGNGVPNGYDLNMNETINLILPYQTTSGEAILVGAIKDVTVSTPITISANASAELAGTLFSGSISESNIVLGGKTLVITLTDGQWVTDIKTNSSRRSALYAGLVASTETTEWAKVISALQAAGETAITRTSDTAITIILPTVSSYNITSNQYVTANIPAACIIGAKALLIAGNTIIIERVATATLSGTAVGSSVTETDIKNGGKTIVITLNNANWVENITTNEDAKKALFDGFVADVENDTQWAKVVSALKNGQGSVTKTQTNVITITLPSASTYDLSAAKQTINVTVPTVAAIGTSFSIGSTNSLVINSTPPVAAYITKVSVPGTAGSYPTVYKLDDIIDIKVEFNTEVDVVGTPIINLETGNIDRNAQYTTGSGINVLTFRYQVQAGDNSQKLEYKLASSLVLLSASIVNSGTSVKANTALPTPGSTGSLSETSNILVDAVAPQLATGFPQKGTITETSANILVMVKEAAQIYYVTVPNDSSNVALSADQIINEVNTTGTAISTDMKGVSAAVENVILTLPNAGLTAYTAYTTYIIAVDSLNNKSAVTAYGFNTADTTAPQIISGYPIQKTPTSDNKIEIEIKVDEGGNVYMIALPTGSQAPTSEQVKAFKNANNAPASGATATITSASAITLPITGLPVSTTYDIYVVCMDASGNISTPASISATTSQLKLDNVGVDLTKKQITNTTVDMEYSFDELIWSPCTASNTNIVFDDSVEILTISVREAKKIDNAIRLLPTRENINKIDKSLIDYDIAGKKIINASEVNLQYRINGGSWMTLNASGSAINVDFVPGPLDVRTVATQNYLPSNPVNITTIADQMMAPELTFNDDENVINGMESKYEYKVDTGTWKNAITDGELVGTKKVSIREKATKEKLPSYEQVIQFTAGIITVVAAPVVSDSEKKIVTITFEENTNKKGISLTAQNLKDWFLVGTWSTTTGAIVTEHSWGTDLTASFNSTGNAITINYKTMTGASIQIGDEVRVTTAAGIKNAAGTSDNYTSNGTLTGSFHTVPKIVSIVALNSNNLIGFNSGDKVVITFDQKTNMKDIGITNIDTYLKLTDSTGKISKPWKITNDSDIVWNTSGTALTITFDATAISTGAAIKPGDKITVSSAWGLKDGDQTTGACSSSLFVSGSFTSTPKIIDAVYTGDTVTITFDQATNIRPISGYQLNNWLRLKRGGVIHSWGVKNDQIVTWIDDGKVLTIKLKSTEGVTLEIGDTLTLNTYAEIKDVDNSTPASNSSFVIK